MKLNEGRALKQFAESDARAFAGFTGFEENLQASVSLMIDEEQSASSTYDYEKTYDNLPDAMIGYFSSIGNNYTARRNKQMQALIAGGVIDQSVKDSFTTRIGRSGFSTDWEAMAIYVNENLDIGTEIATNEGYELLRNEAFAQKRTLRKDIQARQTTSGYIGELAGYALGGMTDPLIALTMPFTAPLVGATQVSRAMYTISGALRTAAFEAGIQAAIEPFIHNWKEEIGADYTWQDSLYNIIGTGVLSGAVGGVVANLSHTFSTGKFAGKPLSFDEILNRNKKIFSDEDAESFAIFEHELNNAPNKDLSAEEFVADLEIKQEKMINEGAEKADVVPELDATESAKPSIKDTDADAKTKKGKAKGKKKAKKAKKETKKQALAREKEQLLALQVESKEAKTVIDEMFDELPDDEFIFVDGANIPIKKMAADIDDDIKEMDEMIRCMISGL